MVLVDNGSGREASHCFSWFVDYAFFARLTTRVSIFVGIFGAVNLDTWKRSLARVNVEDTQIF